jgi:hypothetical protein
MQLWQQLALCTVLILFHSLPLLNATCIVGKTGSTCTNCVAGKYKSVTGTAACINCVAGKYSPHIAATSESTCVMCEAGKYSFNPAAISESTCRLCLAGTWSSWPGSSQPCVSCVSGKFSVTAGATQESTCIACTAGKYSYDSAATFCDICGAGKYSDTAQAIDCINCLPGKYSGQEGASSVEACIDCPAGKTSSSYGTISNSVCQVPVVPIPPSLSSCVAGQYGTKQRLALQVSLSSLSGNTAIDVDFSGNYYSWRDCVDQTCKPFVYRNAPASLPTNERLREANSIWLRNDGSRLRTGARLLRLSAEHYNAGGRGNTYQRVQVPAWVRRRELCAVRRWLLQGGDDRRRVRGLPPRRDDGLRALGRAGRLRGIARLLRRFKLSALRRRLLQADHRLRQLQAVPRRRNLAVRLHHRASMRLLAAGLAGHSWVGSLVACDHDTSFYFVQGFPSSYTNGRN